MKVSQCFLVRIECEPRALGDLSPCRASSIQQNHPSATMAAYRFIPMSSRHNTPTSRSLAR
jgi:hypothetical protein